MKPNTRRLLNEDDTTTLTSSSSSSSSGSTYPSLSRQQQLPSLPYDSNSPERLLTPTSNFDSSMVVTLLVLLTAFFFMGFFSVYVRRFAEDNAAAEFFRRRRQGSGGTPSSLSSPHGVDPTIVRALPLFAYDGSAKGPLECVICLSEFEEKETVKIIPSCGHVYHPQCIDSWLSRHVSCPLCRSTQLVSKQGVAVLEVFDEMPERAGDIDDEVESETGGREGYEGVGIEEEEEEEGQLVVLRRTSSCSRIGKRVLLPRSSSF